MAEESDDKSQEATPYRREKAREQGQVPRSQDISSAALMVAGLLAMRFFGPRIVDSLAQYTAEQLGGAPWLMLDHDSALANAYHILWSFASLALPFMFLMLGVGLFVHWAQVGFLFVPDKLAPDWNRIDPLQGFQRLFAVANVVRLVFGLIKLTLVGSLAVWYVQDELPRMMTLADLEPRPLAVALVDITLNTSLKVAIALLLLAVFDYFYQWWQNEQNMRMSRQEIIDEFKLTQGDPKIASRRKLLYRQLAANRVRSAVPKADAIITNPTELAIAISYDPETMTAPIVTAKGAGAVAQTIRRLALENSVPIIERKELARFLYKNVEINQPVPVDQYAAVAEILRYAYELRGKKPPSLNVA